ncbi:sugar transferase [Gaetbulibacter saemankumensis]|uniref:sugar transferase n=1 Tax=Gaetbulibacter saemankumensis TaxID=311208 RepID=UPI000402F402|nr:sugar transferase [Gaetbulibacter saemankumensis]
MLKRSFDIFFSTLGLVLLSPLFLCLAILIKFNSKGPVFFKQNRVGLHNKDFKIYKFRTMKLNSEFDGLLTIGNKDSRITKVGLFLRRYKIDELPQLYNILKGDMSFVGPRAELRHFVNYYNEDDLNIFSVRPGLTGLASLNFRNEVELLKNQKAPEIYYIKNIIPAKLKFNKVYLKKSSFLFDLKILWRTIFIVIFN